MQIASILDRLHTITPETYAKSRNYGDGAVTYLSPYISRGVLSTRQVYEHILTLDLPWYKAEKLIQELAWRDYWQQVWIAKGDAIDQDLKNVQSPIHNHQIPAAVVKAETGIDLVDKAIRELYETGYMHNHMRMYVASICCHFANSHWREPAKWMYAHLLDGDIASNHLSWQWVAGAFSNKKYFMNQENINKYFHGSQQGTFLDLDYELIGSIDTPKILEASVPFVAETSLPLLEKPKLENKKTLIYNYYNLDPFWHKDEAVQRVLLLEPSIFKERPVGQKCIDFALGLSKNIPDIITFVGEFEELLTSIDQQHIVYKEHPLNYNYRGLEEPREWLSSINGYFPSFFAFYKKCKKQLFWSSD